MQNNVLNITHSAFRKMVLVSQIVNDKYEEEVLGLLVIEEGKNNKGLTVVDVIIPEQKISSANCEMIIGETISQKCIPKKLIPKIKGWFHSHKNMGCWYSGVDDTTLENWAYALPYAVGIVVSLPNSIKAYIQYGKPILTEKIEITTNIVYDSEEDIKTQLEKELEQKIIKPTKKEKKQKKQKDTQTPYINPSYPYNYVRQYEEDKEPLIKDSKTLTEEVLGEATYEPLSIDKLPESTKFGCGALNYDNEEDIICGYTALPPDCINCVGFEKLERNLGKLTVNDKDKPNVNLRCDHLRLLKGVNMLRYSTYVRNKILKKDFKDFLFICNLGLNMKGNKDKTVLNCSSCGSVVNVASLKPIEQKDKKPITKLAKPQLKLKKGKTFLKIYCPRFKKDIRTQLEISSGKLKYELEKGNKVRCRLAICYDNNCAVINVRKEGCLLNKWFWVYPSHHVELSQHLGFMVVTHVEEKN